MVLTATPGRTALWVLPVAELGGVARHALDVLTTGIPGWRTVLLCPPGPLARAAEAAGVAVLTGPVSPADGIPAGLAAVRHALATLRPSLVHSHLSYADLLAALGTVGPDVALVTTEHGIAADDLVYHRTRWRSRVRALAHAARLRRADALIAVSRSTLDVVRAKWHPPAGLATVVILNGVDANPPQVPRSPGLHVLSLARLAPEKGLTDLLRAFALLAQEHPQAHLTLAGEGPLDGELRDLSRALGLEARVSFPGHVDPAPLLASGDVLAQLSLWENCSYSILDALGHCLGVVATGVGGNPELLPDSALVDRSNHRQVAAALARQGLDLAARPTLPPHWPTMEDMCAAISETYAGVAR